jgi:cytochrome c oxidase assembly protein subunit 15
VTPLPRPLARISGYRPSARDVRVASLGALIGNVVIVVTGGAVRLTGSGLGCPTVPRCTDDSWVATPEMGVHGAIEFGNRMLTYVLSAAVAAAIITTMRQRPRRPALARLAWALFAGVVVQAVIGAVTVVTGLHPVTVMLHFLVSMLLVAAATVLHWRSRESSDAPARPLVRPELRRVGQLLLGTVAVTLFLGTVVTGSGPHSGDSEVSHRLPIAPETAAQVHADFVFLLFGLAIALLLALRATGAPAAVSRATLVLLAVAASQGLIGYVQYFTELPIVLVGLHMLGACLVWIAALRVYLSMSARPEPARPESSAEESSAEDAGSAETGPKPLAAPLR